MRETILTSDRWESNARHGCPAPRHHGLHAIINYIRLSAKFAEIGPIEQTMNSYQNHEFIPPGRKTNLFIGPFPKTDITALQHKGLSLTPFN
jgi:hypothetical protein